MSTEATDPPSSGVYTYDSLLTGTRIGAASLCMDHETLRLWARVYGPLAKSEHLPSAAAPLLLMQAFTTIVSPRPPGNLHVSQSCNIYRLPRVGSVIAATVDCIHKELRGDRRLVDFHIELRNADGSSLIASGLTRIFWAL
ncbi:MAG: hypothetical protein AB7N70_01220 [Dehalococcoidia bacterium]